MSINSEISKVIVAITGASGSIYGNELIKQLSATKSIQEIAVIFSESGADVWAYEKMPKILGNNKIIVYKNNDLFAAPSSGSSGYCAMFIAPCSAGTLAAIASGTASTLIHRSADVMLKERKPLLLLLRETPLNLIHIENMKMITLAGGIIFPAAPFFYHRPKKINDLVETLVSRLLYTAGISVPKIEWKGN